MDSNGPKVAEAKAYLNRENRQKLLQMTKEFFAMNAIS